METGIKLQTKLSYKMELQSLSVTTSCTPTNGDIVQLGVIIKGVLRDSDILT